MEDDVQLLVKVANMEFVVLVLEIVVLLTELLIGFEEL